MPSSDPLAGPRTVGPNDKWADYYGTTLREAVAANDNQIKVAAVDFLTAGDQVIIGSPYETQVTRTIDSISGQIVTLTANVGVAYAVNAPVIVPLAGAALSRATGYDPRDYGAVTDGTTDDNTAIVACLAAIAAAQAAGQVCTYRQTGGTGYASSLPVTIPAGVHVQMDVPMIYTGSANSTFLTIGASGTNNPMRTIVVRVRRSAVSDWTSDASIGVSIINADTCDVRIEEAYGFTINAEVIGDNGGFAYNRVSLGQLGDGKYQFQLNSKNGGWCNENTYNGGRVFCSNVNPTKSTYGVRFTSDGVASPNNNVFMKTSFELIASYRPGYEAIPVLMEYGSRNEFRSARQELCSDIFVRETNAATENSYEIGYGGAASSYPVVDSQSTAPHYIIRGARTRVVQGPSQLVWESGPLHKQAVNYNGATGYWHVANVNLGNVSNATPNIALPNIAPATRYLALTSASFALGIFVDTTLSKRFVLRSDVEPTDETCVTSGNAADGQKVIPCVATAGMVGGQSIFIERADKVASQFATIASVSAGVSITVVANLTHYFPTGSIVTNREGKYAGNSYVVCYDGAGTILSDAYPVYGPIATPPTAHYYFTGGTGMGDITTACSWVFSETTKDRYFVVPPEAKYIRVLIRSATLRIRSFSIWAVDAIHGQPAAWTGLEDVAPRDVNVATAAPTSGTYATGKQLRNATPASLGSIGWVCTAGGTPGTWTTFGTIA